MGRSPAASPRADRSQQRHAQGQLTVSQTPGGTPVLLSSLFDGDSEARVWPSRKELLSDCASRTSPPGSDGGVTTGAIGVIRSCVASYRDLMGERDRG
jgi:hypothetical protein